MTKILIISAGFYEDYEKMLLEGAIAELKNEQYEYEIEKVPGCFEIPAAISMAIKNGKYDGFVTLGCVIRGQTTHYDYVCLESARGINHLAIKHNTPIGFGIITAENDEQAYVRADSKQKNVGGKSARACIAMINLKKKLGI